MICKKIIIISYVCRFGGGGRKNDIFERNDDVDRRRPRRDDRDAHRRKYVLFKPVLNSIF